MAFTCIIKNCHWALQLDNLSGKQLWWWSQVLLPNPASTSSPEASQATDQNRVKDSGRLPPSNDEQSRVVQCWWHQLKYTSTEKVSFFGWSKQSLWNRHIENARCSWEIGFWELNRHFPICLQDVGMEIRKQTHAVFISLSGLRRLNDMSPAVITQHKIFRKLIFWFLDLRLVEKSAQMSR